MTTTADAPRPWLCPRGPACPARRAHDTYSAYRYGCRSDAARADAARYAKAHRTGRHTPRRVPSIGTARRLRALAALGWDTRTIASHLGCRTRHVAQLRAAENPTCTRRTACRVTTLYDELGMTPGPSPAAAAEARRRGWAPPLAWDDIDDPRASTSTSRSTSKSLTPDQPDPAVPDALLAGRVTWTNVPDVDREHVVEVLRGRGHTLIDIAVRVGAPSDAVHVIHERLATRRRRTAAREQEAA